MREREKRNILYISFAGDGNRNGAGVSRGDCPFAFAVTSREGERDGGRARTRERPVGGGMATMLFRRRETEQESSRLSQCRKIATIPCYSW